MTFRVLAAFAVTVLLSLPSLTVAGDPATEKGGTDAVAAAVPAQSVRAQPAARAAAQGIKVHGDWVIEVKSPDGSVLQRYEFSNALIGANLLTALLSGDFVARTFAVAVTAQTNLCATTGTCYMVDPQWPFGSSGYTFRTLTVSRSPDLASFVFSGTLPAGADTSLAAVRTLVYTCPNTAPFCTVPSEFAFTYKLLDAPIPVISGQVIAVTVRISFS